MLVDTRKDSMGIVVTGPHGQYAMTHIPATRLGGNERHRSCQALSCTRHDGLRPVKYVDVHHQALRLVRLLPEEWRDYSGVCVTGARQGGACSASSILRCVRRATMKLVPASQTYQLRDAAPQEGLTRFGFSRMRILCVEAGLSALCGMC